MELLNVSFEFERGYNDLARRRYYREADHISPIGRSSPGYGVSAEEFAARESMLKELKSRLLALVAENVSDYNTCIRGDAM